MNASAWPIGSSGDAATTSTSGAASSPSLRQRNQYSPPPISRKARSADQKYFDDMRGPRRATVRDVRAAPNPCARWSAPLLAGAGLVGPAVAALRRRHERGLAVAVLAHQRHEARQARRVVFDL